MPPLPLFIVLLYPLPLLPAPALNPPKYAAFQVTACGNMVSKNKVVTDGDPLACVLAPPPNETEEQRQIRLAAEAEAKRISDAIDEELQRQAKAEKRGPKTIKILLLGGSIICSPSVVVVCGVR